MPAVIFVFAKTDLYKPLIQRVSHWISQYEPEVSLAVRVSREEIEAANNEDEDDIIADEFFSAQGFEFVDASSPRLSRDNDRHDGIPGLPRVVDALSTIMWPSMRPIVHTRSQRPPALHPQLSTDWMSNGSFNMQDEVAALERWLEDDSPSTGTTRSQDDPWSSTQLPITDRIFSSPVDDPKLAHDAKLTTFGFDDDFTVYVSAPVIPTSPSNASFELNESETPSTGFLDAGYSYRSLGSASDLGEVHEFDQNHELTDEDDEDDEDLPTREEIRETATRLFGPSLVPPMLSETSTTIGINDSTTPLPEHEGESEKSKPSFDLGNVMNALEGMKVEIAGMTDDGERRKAAARVALGLVYGLQGEQ